MPEEAGANLMKHILCEKGVWWFVVVTCSRSFAIVVSITNGSPVGVKVMCDPCTPVSLPAGFWHQVRVQQGTVGQAQLVS